MEQSKYKKYSDSHNFTKAFRISGVHCTINGALVEVAEVRNDNRLANMGMKRR